MNFEIIGQLESEAAASSFFSHGLSVELLRTALKNGDAARRGCHDTDPDDYPARTANVVAYRYLFGELRSLGWQHENERGQIRLVTPDGRHALVLATGDENTGLRHGHQPRTRSAKGEVTTNAIRLNRDLPLFGEDAAPSGAELWFVLVTWIEDEEESEIRFELSRPVGQQASGVISLWDARVVFEPIRSELNTYDEVEELEDEVDFKIERK